MHGHGDGGGTHEHQRGGKHTTRPTKRTTVATRASKKGEVTLGDAYHFDRR